MNSTHFSAPSVVTTRVTDNLWHALEDDQVVGRGDATRRPDGRIFLGIDSWHGSVFDLLAEAMLTNLPGPLYTVVDEADADLMSSWRRAGFAIRRREWEYSVPTDPAITGLDSALPPSDVTILGVGKAEVGRLATLDRQIRQEVEATVGWQSMPAEVLCRPQGPDPAMYAVAAQSDRYVGLIRLAAVPRLPRIGLIAVLADQHRRGIARALLAHVLGSLHRIGTVKASAEVNEANEAALALFEGIGAYRVGSNLELVRP